MTRALPTLLLPVLLLSGLPLATAGCADVLSGTCLRDLSDPCDVLGCSIACGGTLGACVHPERCLAGDLPACVELDQACPHAECPPPDA